MSFGMKRTKIAKELHSIIDLSNEKEVRYLYNIALGMQALRA